MINGLGKIPPGERLFRDPEGEKAKSDAKSAKEDKRRGREQTRKDLAEEREDARKWAKRSKDIGETTETATKVALAPVEAGASVASSILRGLTKVKGSMPKGIVHPDSLIRNKDLYLGMSSDKLSPIGRRVDNPMELYFGRKSIEKDMSQVLGAIQSGVTDTDTIAVMTGLSGTRVNSALRELAKKEAIDPSYLG